jgi:hypothetical protein
MRFFTPTIALFLCLVTAGASSTHGGPGLSARHNKLARNVVTLSSRGNKNKKCVNRVNKNATSLTGPDNADAVTPSSKSAAPKPAPTSTKKPANTPASAPVSKPATNKGLINVQSNCGPSGATAQITRLSGPNGNIDWLNCGFETSAGWQPPNIQMKDVITQPLSSALQSPSSPFKACSKYISMFEQYGNQFGVAPIMLASFAMQESSCNPDTIGGGGEQGLMQITREKCGGAPGGNCRDPDFNIRTAASFFAQTVKDNGGNVLLSVGAYNGWRRGLTKSAAFAAAHSSCCRCQNNGDYLHQFFNGWCQNINAYDAKMPLGKYFNLDQCS